MLAVLRRIGPVAVASAGPLFLATCKGTEPSAPTDVTVTVVQVGNNLTGLVGYPVNIRPAVRVTDRQHLPVSGATVTFGVASGGGSATGPMTATNADGFGQVGSWTLGASAGVNTMVAAVSGSGIRGVTVTFTDTALVGSYTIAISYYGATPSAGARAAMDSAVARWEQIIYRSVGAITLDYPAGTCGAGTPAISQSVSNLLILAKFDSIDGPGKILGQSGPCVVRSTGLTAVGVMEFDSSDVDTLLVHGQLGEVMLHEMGHVIGFGTLWGPPQPQFGVVADCLQDPSSAGSPRDTYFSCPRARAAFDSMGGTTYTGAGQTVGGNKVPVENCGNAPYVAPRCGAATLNGHWRETVFANELMTGFLNPGVNPLSVLTVAAQEDLGYTVNYAAADPFTHAFSAPPAGGAAPLALGDDIRHGPIYVADRSGRIIGTYRRR